MELDRGRLEMLKEIMAIEFSGIELCLYLDTHPYDQRALGLHNQYVMKLMELKEIYQKEYGFLTCENVSECPWQWMKEPWPWEIDYEMGGK